MKLLICVFLFLFINSILISSPSSPTPYFHVPGDASGFCLEVYPRKEGKAVIRCFSLTGGIASVERKQMWVCDDINYPFPGGTFLHFNGLHMACLRFPDASDKDKLNDIPFINFYDSGKHISTILLKDVIDINKIAQNPFDSYTYLVLKEGETCNMGVTYGIANELKRFDIDSKIDIDDTESLFYLVTHQEYLLVFKMKDGKLIYRRRLNK